MNDTTGVDMSNLATKSDFIALKAEIDKLNILVNVQTGFNNLKTNIVELGVGKLKSIPIDFKKLSDVVSKEVVENTEFDKLNTKVNSLGINVPDKSIQHK